MTYNYRTYVIKYLNLGYLDKDGYVTNDITKAITIEAYVPFRNMDVDEDIINRAIYKTNYKKDKSSLHPMIIDVNYYR